MHSNILSLMTNRGPYLCGFALKRRKTKSAEATFFLVLSIYADTSKSPLGKEQHIGNFLTREDASAIKPSSAVVFLLLGLKIKKSRGKIKITHLQNNFLESLQKLIVICFWALFLLYFLSLFWWHSQHRVQHDIICHTKLRLPVYLPSFPGKVHYKPLKKMDLSTKLRSYIVKTGSSAPLIWFDKLIY